MPHSFPRRRCLQNCGAANPGCSRLSAGSFEARNGAQTEEPPERRLRARLPAPHLGRNALLKKLCGITHSCVPRRVSLDASCSRGRRASPRWFFNPVPGLPCPHSPSLPHAILANVRPCGNTTMKRIREFLESIVFAGMKPGTQAVPKRNLQWLGPLRDPIEAPSLRRSRTH